MPDEIERKFLLKKQPEVDRTTFQWIEQGYVCLGDKEEVRLRKSEDLFGDIKYTITVKKGSGLVRGEYETPLSKDQFILLWPTTEGRRLYKKRYLVQKYPRIEIDVYRQNLDGLLIAEVEFKTVEEAQQFIPFEWMDLEVTDDARYKNRALALDQEIPTYV